MPWPGSLLTPMSISVASSSPRHRAASPSESSPDSNPYKKLYRPRPHTPRRPLAAIHVPPARDSDIWSSGIYTSSAERILRTLLGPVALLVAAPVFVNVAALAAKGYDSDIVAVLSAALADSPTFLSEAFPLPSFQVICAVASFVLFQLALFVLVPGQLFPGVRAPSGFVPQFKRNGVPAFAVTGAAFVLCHTYHVFPGEFIYDNLMQIMTLLNISAIAFALLLFIKGIYAPSTPDHGSSEFFPFRIYWGEELYPSIMGVDLKHFVICRIGMMSWWLFTISFMLASIRRHGALTPSTAASAFLNVLYVLKFSHFEVPGYPSAADIAVDRFGFMLCWGTIAFMPLVHNLQTLHLVNGSHVLPLSWPATAAWIALGIVMIALNYDSDTQRHRVRALNGKCLVWGRPARVIRAVYRDATGSQHCNLLLACGYHGIVRHFHYAPDIVLLFLYCAPAGFSRLLPFTYFFYLTALLLDRCQRIDRRCRAKYGDAWDEYAKLVPYKLLPGLF